MKNLIISVLLTFIFYTQFCEIKIPYIMPVLALIVWMIISEIDEYIADYKRSVNRGQRLQRKINRTRRGA